MNVIHTAFKKIPNVTDAEAREVAKRLISLDQIATQIGKNELATKKDIAEFKISTKEDITNLKISTKADIEELKDSIKVDIAKLKADTNAGFANLKSELTWRMVIAMGVGAAVISAVIKIL